jgi:hypothetical protein
MIEEMRLRDLGVIAEAVLPIGPASPRSPARPARARRWS